MKTPAQWIEELRGICEGGYASREQIMAVVSACQREAIEECITTAEHWASSAAHMSVKPRSQAEYSARANEAEQIADDLRALLPPVTK